MNRQSLELTSQMKAKGTTMKHIFALTALLLAPWAALPAAEPRVFDITAFGAKGDGATLNTDAIQRAADACHDAGGGVVRVPKGVFVTGSVRLKSGVILRIEKDAVLRGSPKIADYAVETAPLHWGAYWKFVNSQFRSCLIYAHHAERVGIEGEGTIDGQGGHERKVFPNAGDSRRPMLVRFERCRHVILRGVTLLDPASFTTFFVRSEDIQIENVVVRSRNSPNGDGLDFDGCRRVRIRDCDLDTGDDAIGPKTFQPDGPNEDFEISGCRISARWAAVRIGAESIAPIRRLTVRHCRFTGCQSGIKIESSEGAMFEDLHFAGIEMRDVCQPFMVLSRPSTPRGRTATSRKHTRGSASISSETASISPARSRRCRRRLGWIMISMSNNSSAKPWPPPLARRVFAVWSRPTVPRIISSRSCSLAGKCGAASIRTWSSRISRCLAGLIPARSSLTRRQNEQSMKHMRCLITAVPAA